MGEMVETEFSCCRTFSYVIEGADFLKTLVAEVAVTALLECFITFINSYVIISM